MIAKYLYAGIVVAALVIVTGAYVKGRSDGRSSAEADARKGIVNQLTERGKIDEDIQGMSADQLCRKLDGVWRNDRCE